jgi:hypothetical protein
MPARSQGPKNLQAYGNTASTFGLAAGPGRCYSGRKAISTTRKQFLQSRTLGFVTFFGRVARVNNITSHQSKEARI